MHFRMCYLNTKQKYEFLKKFVLIFVQNIHYLWDDLQGIG